MKEIEIPRQGRLIRDFIQDVITIFQNEGKDILFYRQDIKKIVKISKLKYENINFIGFEILEPNTFITTLEEYAIPGVYEYNKRKGDFDFIKKSISNQVAKVVLDSDEFKISLQQINKIFYTPIPFLYDNSLTFPKKGYDERFKSWTLNNSPDIEELSLEESKEIIEKIMEEFCFKEKQDKMNAIAGLLTPFLRGLYDEEGTRTPIFFYLGNRERVGKDYLASITGIIHEGFALEEAPIEENSELRKKILSTFINGRKRFHSSNNRGYLNSSVLESISTAKVWNDRLLGKNENLTFNNELELSLSGNIGITYTPDLANRSVFVRLFLEIEDANSRKFENPKLHYDIYRNRSKILSALYSLILNWFNNGCKKGTIPFSSFPEWSEICGGIMESAGYSNPCIKCESAIYQGDSETTEMKEFFERCFENFGKTIVKVEELRILADREGFFTYLELHEFNGKQKFGIKINKYMGRVLGGIKLVEINDKQIGSKKEVKFIKKNEI